MHQWINEFSMSPGILLSAFSVRLLLLVLGGWAIARVARRASAAFRHHVWLTVLTAAILLPLLTCWMPSLAVLPGIESMLPESQAESVHNPNLPDRGVNIAGAKAELAQDSGSNASAERDATGGMYLPFAPCMMANQFKGD